VSSQSLATDVELRALIEADVESAIPHGAALLAFASALVLGEAGPLDAARERLLREMGEAALVDAAGVASNFQRMVRIADGTGIPLGEGLETRSQDVRAELGLERFRKENMR
jgi:hypothetical protein